MYKTINIDIKWHQPLKILAAKEKTTITELIERAMQKTYGLAQAVAEKNLVEKVKVVEFDKTIPTPVVDNPIAGKLTNNRGELDADNYTS